MATKSPAPRQKTRVSQADVGSRRAGYDSGAPGQGKEATVGLIGRISLRSDFARLHQRGITVRSGPLRIKYCRADGGGGDSLPASHRLAFDLSRKLGSAVVRNRFRRQLKAMFYELARDEGELLPHGDYLVRLQPSKVAKNAPAAVKRQAHSWSYAELSGHVDDALGKLRAKLANNIDVV